MQKHCCVVFQSVSDLSLQKESISMSFGDRKPQVVVFSEITGKLPHSKHLYFCSKYNPAL